MRVNRGLRRRFCDILMNLYRSLDGSNEQMLISYSFNTLSLKHIVMFSENFSSYTAVSSRPNCANIGTDMASLDLLEQIGAYCMWILVLLLSDTSILGNVQITQTRLLETCSPNVVFPLRNGRF